MTLQKFVVIAYMLNLYRKCTKVTRSETVLV